MNDKQKICLWVGIALIVVMGLFPPWVLESQKKNYLGYGRGYEYKYTTKAGIYSWIVAPPRQQPNLLTYIVLVSNTLLLLL